jgi:hypothetical protein
MFNFLQRLFGEQPTPLPSHDAASLPQPVQPRVLVIIHDPIMRSRGGRKLHQVFGWNDPDALAKGYAADIRQCSYGYADYRVVERVEVDRYPLKLDRFTYDEHSYLRAWDRRDFHQPDAVDYLKLVDEFDMVRKVDSGAIDEVWLLGFPYTGYFESIMAGPDAFWCNAPPLAGTEHCSRRFVIMGFNYERGVGEMLEDLGHRAESHLSRVFERTRGDANLFERFTRYDLKFPGRAEVGNVHFAPNSVKDYDWGNPRYVASRCDDWYNFPNVRGQARRVNCSEWGNGDIREHHRWWFRHFPHTVGASNGISHNWWEYVIDPNRVA